MQSFSLLLITVDCVSILESSVFIADSEASSRPVSLTWWVRGCFFVRDLLRSGEPSFIMFILRFFRQPVFLKRDAIVGDVLSPFSCCDSSSLMRFTMLSPFPLQTLKSKQKLGPIFWSKSSRTDAKQIPRFSAVVLFAFAWILGLRGVEGVVGKHGFNKLDDLALLSLFEAFGVWKDEAFGLFLQFNGDILSNLFGRGGLALTNLTGLAFDSVAALGDSCFELLHNTLLLDILLINWIIVVVVVELLFATWLPTKVVTVGAVVGWLLPFLALVLGVVAVGEAMLASFSKQ